MSNSQPPRLASWLLACFISGPQSDSLVGDMVEQYRSGRSAAWYWRQVLSAVLSGAARDIRTHQLRALSAVAAGWVFYVLFSFPVNWLQVPARRQATRWLAEAGQYSEWGVFWAGVVPATLLVYTACFISGLIIGRLYWRHGGAMVAVYAASVLAFEYTFIAIGFAWGGRYPQGPIGMLIVPALLTLGRPICILAGGLMSARIQRPTAAL